MSNYTVTFLITFSEDVDEILYSVTEDFDAKNLQSLYDLLDEGIQDYSINPEQNIMIDMPIDHDFNVFSEWVIIRDEDGKEVYRDKNFKEELVPVENRIV
jgi:hypothetical protein